MTTFHAVAWLDHTEAHVVHFDRDHTETQRIKARSHHKHQGKAADNAAFFGDIAAALSGAREVLLTGPGLARTQLREWVGQHLPLLDKAIVDSVATDHPSDAQLAALARQYFRKFDSLAADPSLA